MKFLLLVILALGTATALPLIIDTDMDIDDVAAFQYILRRPKGTVDLRLVTVTGNSWAYLSSGVLNLYNILHQMGRDDIDVGVGYSYAWRNNETHGCSNLEAIPNGGSGSWGAGGGRFEISMLYGSAAELATSPRQWKTTDLGAVAKMKAAVDAAAPDRVTLLAIGGMTTFATYFKTYPQDIGRIDRLYIMGGAVNHPGNVFTVPTNPYAEFNIYVDPDAASFVVRSGVPVYLVPLDVTNSIPYTTTIFNRLIDPTQTPPWLATLMQRNRDALNMTDPVFFTTIFPWDEFATATVSDSVVRAATTFVEMRITVVTEDGPELGRTKLDLDNGFPIMVANATSPDVFWNSWFTTVHP